MSDPYELVERKLERILHDGEDSRGMHFFLQVGGRYDERGIVTLQISGSGWTFLSYRIDDTVKTYNTLASRNYMLRLYEFLLDHPFWRVRVVRRKKNPKIDESNVHLRISDQEKGNCSAIQFWTTDIANHKPLKDVLFYFEDVVKVLSNGEALLDLSSTPISKRLDKSKS